MYCGSLMLLPPRHHNTSIDAILFPIKNTSKQPLLLVVWFNTVHILQDTTFTSCDHLFTVYIHLVIYYVTISLFIPSINNVSLSFNVLWVTIPLPPNYHNTFIAAMLFLIQPPSEQPLLSVVWLNTVHILNGHYPYELWLPDHCPHPPCGLLCCYITLPPWH
mgnify:FL=1